MSKNIALIDGNNFYASCEQMIDPSLAGNPLVVLSNNDGCIISRSPEARELNIPMGIPYFKVNHTLEQLGVKVLSSNYSLYGDMSLRLMNLLQNHCEELEIYSIDEAFAKLSFSHEDNLDFWAHKLRELIYRDLGISIAIGIGRNKVQAKLANYLAKNVASNVGIFNLAAIDDKDKVLELINIENIWGIGKRLSQWLRIQGVTNAKQLRDMPKNKLQAKCGVVGIRLQKELHGEICMKFIATPPKKKETCVSRSFGRAITTKEELRQAIASHVVVASQKLRKQQQRAGAISVFTRTSSHSSTFYSRAANRKLNVPSNDTNILLKIALSLTEQIYRPYTPLMKAGVLMQNLQSMNHLQTSILEIADPEQESRQERLMGTIDNLNKRYGNNSITWCACGINKKWDMRRNKLSPAATTKYGEIPTIRI